MDRLFQKIYGEVIFYEQDIAALNRAIEQKNEEVSLKYKKVLDEKEREELLDLLDDAAISACREGFYKGLCYAFRGMLALLKG